MHAMHLSPAAGQDVHTEDQRQDTSCADGPRPPSYKFSRLHSSCTMLCPAPAAWAKCDDVCGSPEGSLLGGPGRQAALADELPTLEYSPSGACGVDLDRAELLQMAAELFQAIHNASWREGSAVRSTAHRSHCLVVTSKAAVLQWHLLPLLSAIIELALLAPGSADTPPTQAMSMALEQVLQVCELGC